MIIYPMEDFNRPASRIVAGLLSGAVAGIVMGMLAMLHAILLGMSLWTPLLHIGGVWFGGELISGGPGVILLGGLTHLFVSAVLGVIFAMFWARLRTPLLFLTGMAYGILIWAFMSYFLVPAVSEAMFRYLLQLYPFWLVYHLIFGAVLALMVSRLRDPATFRAV
jgi:hypothetical protein